MTGHSTPGCYAAALCDCCGELTAEHVVPDCMLKTVSGGERSVRVDNLPRRSDPTQRNQTPEPRWIGNLVEHVLCARHNNDYHFLDTAGGDLLRGIDAMNDHGSSEPKTIEVNGDRFERCLLKIMLGGVFSGAFPTLGRDRKNEPPREDWLRIVFRGERFPPTQGLWLKGCLNTTETQWRQHIAPEVIHDAQNEIIGLRLVVYGFEFILALAPVPNPCPTLHGADHRPGGIRIVGNHKRIRFKWGVPDTGPETTFEFRTGPG